MPKTKKAEKTKYRLMLHGGTSDGRIVDKEFGVNKPTPLLFVPIPPADVSETEEECRWQVGSYGFKEEANFEELGVHYIYEWVGIIE